MIAATIPSLRIGASVPLHIIQSSTLNFDANVGLLIGANVCLLSLKPIQKAQVAFRRDRRRKPKQLVYRKHDGEELSQAMPVVF
jgi:hypothetical protein